MKVITNEKNCKSFGNVKSGSFKKCEKVCSIVKECKMKKNENAKGEEKMENTEIENNENVVEVNVVEVLVENNDTEKTEKVKKVRACRQIITRSTHGKFQQRTTGSRVVRNQWGHFEGTIAAKIDRMISEGRFTKKEIVAFSGTKMSRINAHINHLRKVKGFGVTVNGQVKFA